VLLRAKDLGEWKIIDIFHKNLEEAPDLLVPFGDDVSVVDLGKDALAAIKTDMLVASTDVPPGMTDWQVGRKAVVGTISDFAAKGVEPKAVLVSLGIPAEYSKASLEALAKGINAGAREYGAFVLGGDTNESGDLVIAVMLLGATTKGQITLRSTAKPNDIVAVTGPFGKTAAGLQYLADKAVRIRKKLEAELLEAVYMPKARLNEGLALSKRGLTTSIIDSSDGLAWSLHELSKSSRKGFIIDKLPTTESVKEYAKMSNIRLEDLILYGGEEYELVMTVNQKKWEEAKEAIEQVGGELIRIGRTTCERGVRYKRGHETILIESRGWEHFKSGDQNKETLEKRFR
jgi:thiamine-monophosphate kinase